MSSLAQLHDIPGLPASIHSEVAILGAMMLDAGAVADATARLVPDDFSLDSHRRIYKAMLDLIANCFEVDLTTLGVALTKTKELAAIGGHAYLAELAIGIPRNLNVESYVRIVKEAAQLRQAYSLFDSTAKAIVAGESDPAALFAWTQRELGEIAGETEQYSLQPVGTFLDTGSDSTLKESLAQRDGIPYGFAELDKATGGAHRGELVIIAARPSMGKTAILCAMARHMALVEGKAVAIFSMEQKALALIRRMLAGSARVSYQNIRKGLLGPHEARLLDEHRDALFASPLHLIDRPALTLSRVRSLCLAWKRECEARGEVCGAIFLDQLSKMGDSDLYRNGMQRHQVVGKISNGLKQLAQELDCPIMLLVQIGREGGKRSDNRPQLTDLKESGNIEEDADVVLFPHRPHYYDKSEPEDKAEIILAKQREGPTGTYQVLYNPSIMRWEDAADTTAQSSFYDR